MAVSIYCPHCHKHTDLRVARYVHSDGYGGHTTEPALWNDAGDEWWIGVCNACQSPVLVHRDGDVIYPTPGAKPTDSNVPKDLRADLDEAKTCFAAACYRGCAVLARRVIQVACIAKGGEETFPRRTDRRIDCCGRDHERHRRVGTRSAMAR